MPGATVTITETRHQHRRRAAVTNESGFYTFPNLQGRRLPRRSRAQRLQEGRARQRAGGRQHHHPRRSRARAGDVSETVNVASETPALQTDRADTGRLIEGEQIAAMPLGFGRNFQGMVATVPGAIASVPPALGVLQLAGFALDQRQRPVASGQQRDDRRHRQQPQDRPADRADPVGGSARDGERDDEQLRRGVRARRRRRHQR